MEVRLAKIRAKEKAQRDRFLRGDQSFKKRKVDPGKNEDDDEEQFVLDDYESDHEGSGVKTSSAAVGFSAATLELMNKLGMGPPASKEEEEEVEDEIKVNSNCLSDLEANRSRSSIALEHTLNSPNSSMNFAE